MEKTKIRLPAGFEDVTPLDIRKWLHVENTVRKVFPRYGFVEIRTPLLEHTRVFARGIGENTDIVEKEMYTFGKGEDSVSLRPEGTAPVIRSYIEQGHDKFGSFQKYWYMGPMFRHERPQKGRKRQFFQAGVEVLGTRSPAADAESVILAQRFLQEVRVSGFSLQLNATGCAACRPRYKEVLREHLERRAADVCDDCRRRMRTNVLRVLDCKRESCRRVFEDLPDILAYLCGECRDHHEEVKRYLFDFKIEFEENRFLVRGLDYYTKTVYEFKHPGLGAQDTIVGGGRYDDLVEQMGGRPQGAVGFAAGLDRLIEVMDELMEEEPREGVFLVTVGEKAYRKGFRLMQELRDNGIKADIDYEARSMKAQLKSADRRNFRMAAILGEEELEKNRILFRDLADGTQTEAALDGFAGRIAKVLREVDEKIKRELQDGDVR